MIMDFPLLAILIFVTIALMVIEDYLIPKYSINENEYGFM